MLRGLLIFVTVVLLSSSPASALWQLEQRKGFAKTTTSAPGFSLEISCRKGSKLQFTLRAVDRAVINQFRNVRGVMMWIELPDGRTDRWPVDVVRKGLTLSGSLSVSKFQLNFFRQGRRFWVDAPVAKLQIMDGGMKGSGAARLAFLEQCGI